MLNNYIRYKGLYVNLNQSPIVLCFLLLVRGGAIGFGIKKSGVFAFVRSFIRCLYLFLKLYKVKTIIFLNRNFKKSYINSGLHLYKIKSGAPLIKMVRTGIKEFYLIECETKKVYNKTVSQLTIKREINQLLEIQSKFDFSPKIKRYDIENKWYCEQFILGNELLFNTENTIKYIMPILKKIITSTPPKRLCLDSYIVNMKSQFMRYNRLNQYDREYKIQKFIEKQFELFSGFNVKEVLLTNNHGDFHTNHLLKAIDSIYLIDWETYGLKSILFDYYRYLFHGLKSGKAEIESLDNIHKHGIKVLDSFAENDHRYPNLQPLAEFYMHVFFVETVCRIVKNYRADNRKIYNVLNWIQSFELYEKYCLERKEG